MGGVIGVTPTGQGLTTHAIPTQITIFDFFNIQPQELKNPEPVQQKPIHTDAVQTKTVQSTFLTLQFIPADSFNISWMKPQRYGKVRLYSWKNAFAVHIAGNKTDILFIREPDAYIYRTLTPEKLDQYLAPCTDVQRDLYNELREVLEDIRIGAYPMICTTTRIDHNNGSGDFAEVGDVSAEGVEKGGDTYESDDY